MANSTLKQDSESLLQILRDIQTSAEDTISYKSFYCKDGYVIHLVPSDFKHFLKDIVNSTKNSFFLVSKLPQVKRGNVDDDESGDEGAVNECNQDSELALPILTQQHVFVGTPIPQKLYNLFQQRDLHGHETETIDKQPDITGLQKLELKYARYFLSLYSRCLQSQKDLPEVWLVCDENNQNVTNMGMVPGVILDSSKKSSQQVSTVLVRSQHFDSGKKDGFTLSDQKKRHMIFNRTPHAETHGYARYNIYGTMESFGTDVIERPESSITIEFAWDRVREILQPPPLSSNAVLNICAHPEDVRNLLSGITSELDLLVNHFAVVQNKLKETNVMEEEEENYDDQELEKKVLAFLDDLKNNSFGTNEQKAESSGSASPTSNLTAPFGIGEALRRQDLDNTESLWLFLKDFTSTNKIVFCLEVIFSLLFDREYRPLLYPTNQTQIAKLMKEVFSCNTDQERSRVRAKITGAFTTCAALQCVVEIGLEKLRKDYSNYFIKQELVTMDKLDYYLIKDVPMLEKLQRLLKLHCVLSLVAVAISYAHITYDNLRELVAAALKFYEKHSHTEHPIFSLSLPAFSAASSNVKNVCIRQFQPQTWMVAITTMNEYITVIQVKAGDQMTASQSLVSFVEQDMSTGGNYVATTATISKVYI